MISSKKLLGYYETIGWLVICETLSLAMFSFFLYTLMTNLGPDWNRLMLVMALYLQIPGIKFIAECLSRRRTRIKKFLVKAAIGLAVISGLVVMALGMWYQTLATSVAIVLGAVIFWLQFFPPKWFKNLIAPWQKAK